MAKQMRSVLTASTGTLLGLLLLATVSIPALANPDTPGIGRAPPLIPSGGSLTITLTAASAATIIVDYDIYQADPNGDLDELDILLEVAAQGKCPDFFVLPGSSPALDDVAIFEFRDPPALASAESISMPVVGNFMSHPYPVVGDFDPTESAGVTYGGAGALKRFVQTFGPATVPNTTNVGTYVICIKGTESGLAFTGTATFTVVKPVGGEILNTDLMTLMVAGTVANAFWILPALAGIGAVIATFRLKRKETEA